MVIHDTQCPHWDQVPLNNRNPNCFNHYVISLADCNDAKLCPVNYFRKNRVLHYEMPDDKYELNDLDKYRVAEIVFDIEGAQATTENK